MDSILSSDYPIGDLQGEADTLNKYRPGDDHSPKLSAALEAFERTVWIASRTKDPVSQGNAIGNIGLVHARLGRTAHAMRSFRRSRSIFVQQTFRAWFNRWATDCIEKGEALRLARQFGRLAELLWRLPPATVNSIAIAKPYGPLKPRVQGLSGALLCAQRIREHLVAVYA